MKNETSPYTPSSLETDTMRELLSRICAAALALDIENGLEQTAKLTALIVNLTKTIRETEANNEKISTTAKDGVFKGTLDERLKGYKPTKNELEDLRSKLKTRLPVLVPRLFEDDDSR